MKKGRNYVLRFPLILSVFSGEEWGGGWALWAVWGTSAQLPGYVRGKSYNSTVNWFKFLFHESREGEETLLPSVNNIVVCHWNSFCLHSHKYPDLSPFISATNLMKVFARVPSFPPGTEDSIVKSIYSLELFWMFNNLNSRICCFNATFTSSVQGISHRRQKYMNKIRSC